MFDLTRRQKLAALVLLVFLAVGGTLLFLKGDKTNLTEYRNLSSESEPIFVHVCGAVKKPGVIGVKPGTRKFDALKQAGGALAEADLARVNLAEFVQDGEQIYLPRVGEVIASPTPRRVYLRKSSDMTKTNGSSGKTTTPAKKPNWPLDLNQVTAAQLESVPGIGPVLAGSIIRYREKQGQFNSYEDLLKVGGVGPAKLEKFRPYLCVK